MAGIIPYGITLAGTETERWLKWTKGEDCVVVDVWMSDLSMNELFEDDKGLWPGLEEEEQSSLRHFPNNSKLKLL